MPASALDLDNLNLPRLVARSLPGVAVMVYDSDLRCLMVEGAILDTIGYQPQQLEGRTLEEALPAEWAAYLTPYYRRALAGESFIFELQNQGLQFDARALPLHDDQGAVVAGMLIIQDVTIYRSSEEARQRHVELLSALRRVNDELNDRLDVAYVLEMALDIAMRLSVARVGVIRLIDDGRIRKAHIAGAYPPEFVRGGYRRVRGIVQRVMDTHQAVLICDTSADPDYVANVPGMRAQMTIPLIARDTLVGIINLETDRPQHFTPDVFEFIKMLADRVSIALDNARLYDTAQRQLKEMQALYDRVSALEQLKSDMIRIAAHDIRNPVNIITGYTHLLRESVSDTQTVYLKAIVDAAQRIEKITHDILSLQRIEQAAGKPFTAQVDLTALVVAACRDHTAQAHLKQLDCALEIPDSPVLVVGDAPQLQEAINNLVSNAIKYTPSGGMVRVTLTHEAGKAAVRVTDTGCGIPAEMQSHLFEPFFRARIRETRDVEGTGLGLHLVGNIIRRHGGDIMFHSVYGQGSTFGFDLPAQSTINTGPLDDTPKTKRAARSRSHQSRPDSAHDSRQPRHAVAGERGVLD